MNYVYLIIGIILLLAAIYCLLQIKSIRDKAQALFLEAEKNITEDKLQYVSENLYDSLPAIVRLFLNYEGFDEIVQKIYDKTRRLAEDILSDGKFNGK
jgi:hypothetical protein